MTTTPLAPLAKSSPYAALAVVLIGSCGFGVTHLSIYPGVEGAIASGLTPFILDAIVKTFAAAATLRFTQSLLHAKA